MARSTVGHILGGRSHLFRPETRELVLRTAEQLGWKRPADWRSVSRGRFGCAVLLKSVMQDRSCIGTNFLVALEEHLLERNMHVAMARLPDATLASETALRRLLKQWSADGMFISYTLRPPPRLHALIGRLDLPAVWLNSRAVRDAVHPDDLGAGRTAAELLLAAGHRRIAYVGYPFPLTMPEEHMHYSMQDRPAGARAAVLACGAAWLHVSGSDSASVATWRERLARPDRETAVIAYNPLQILPVLHAAALLGLRVPQDLSLITFHDETVWMLDQEIASLALPEARSAEIAVAHLCARIGGAPSRALEALPFTVRSTLTIGPPPPRVKGRPTARR
ncbi:MAG: LacI family DNA-binding transcriptional regulator [Planctomycetes bacterium]|nr:LacI family DNA-binding transcriptional regulator [Planctomycetota bacterium]